MATMKKLKKVTLSLGKVVNLLEDCFYGVYLKPDMKPKKMEDYAFSRRASYDGSRYTTVNLYNGAFELKTDDTKTFAVPAGVFIPYVIDHLVSKGRIQSANHVVDVFMRSPVRGSQMLVSMLGILSGLTFHVSDEPLPEPMNWDSSDVDATEEYCRNAYEVK
jgi:hypothetical protein